MSETMVECPDCGDYVEEDTVCPTCRGCMNCCTCDEEEDV
jgi:ribosomal protein L32